VNDHSPRDAEGDQLHSVEQLVAAYSDADRVLLAWILH